MAGPLGGAVDKGPTSATTEVEDVDGVPPEGAGSKVRQRPPPKLKTSMAGPLGVLELKIWEHSTFGARPSDRAVNGCRNLGQMLKELLEHISPLLRLSTFADAFLGPGHAVCPP
jgi:hypothetical protein